MSQASIDELVAEIDAIDVSAGPKVSDKVRQRQPVHARTDGAVSIMKLTPSCRMFSPCRQPSKYAEQSWLSAVSVRQRPECVVVPPTQQTQIC